MSYLVEVSVSEPFDGVRLPIGKGWRKRDSVGKTLAVLRDRLLEHAQGKGAEYGVRLVRDRIGVVARVRGGDLDPGLRIADLTHPGVQFDVQT